MSPSAALEISQMWRFVPVLKLPPPLATWVGIAPLLQGTSTTISYHNLTHTIWSSMPPVEALPPELLGAVFQRLVENILGNNPVTFSQLLLYHQARLRALVTISLVCRRWYTLVSGDGTLWAHIPIDTSRHDCWKSTKCLLIRSKRTALDVSVVLEDSHVLSAAAIMALGVHYARIRSLYLTTDSYTKIFDEQEPATEMRTLAVFNRSKLYSSVARFGGTFPNLRSLTLHGFSSWPSNRFINLKHLKLKSISSLRSVKLSRITGLLKESPDLETLYLSSFLVIVDDSTPTDIVHLRSLQGVSLRLCDSAMILSHLIIPRTSTLDIIMDYRRLQETKLMLPRESHIISSLPPVLSNMHFIGETVKLVLEQDRPQGGFGLALSFPDAETPSLVIVDGSSSIERFIERSLVAISSHSYFEIIRSVTLALSPSIPISWPNLFGRFNQLLELNAAARNGLGVLTALMHLRDDGTPFCSSLSRIRFFEQKTGVSSIFDHRLLQLLSDFRASFRCAPTKITVHDVNGHRVQRFVCRSNSR